MNIGDKLAQTMEENTEEILKRSAYILRLAHTMRKTHHDCLCGLSKEELLFTSTGLIQYAKE